MAEVTTLDPRDGNEPHQPSSDTSTKIIEESLETDYAFRALTGVQSDLVIKCGGEEWRVHKAIVSNRSDFFKKACNGKFRESEENIVNLPEDDPLDVDAMIQYMYLGSYKVSDEKLEVFEIIEEEIKTSDEAKSTQLQPDSHANGPHDSGIMSEWGSVPYYEHSWARLSHPVLTDGFVITRETYDKAKVLPFHAKVYAIGEKYQVLGLKFKAAVAFEKSLGDEDQQVHTKYFRDSVRIAYSSTPDDDRVLRLAVAKAIVRDMSAVRGVRMNSLLKEIPDLALNLLHELSNKFSFGTELEFSSEI